MNDDSTPLDDDAFGWALRMEGPDADWDAFTLWLEHDASRSGRYDRAVAALHDVTADVAALQTVPIPASGLIAANDDMPARRHTRRWIGGALAAVLAGAIGLGVWTQAPYPYAVETAPGEQRTVALADGSSIVLAGGSKVRLDHNAPRVATVERGEMLFRVRHDAAHPFTVGVGDLTLADLGTVFDVKADPQRTRVSVAEGAVMVDPEGAALRLDAGQAVIAEGDALRRQAVERNDVGAWREGRLAFDDVSLEEVAADLSRQIGQPVRAAPAVARRTFRGTLDVQALKRRPALLGQLLDVTVRQQPDGWTLEPHP
ncbi:FecR family protein [Sphingomonas sp. Leaf343]|uniref:FecR family protein n=1 Tax=Sphingomonas sp. Leaf343 TaxID=1736345 RepID=UPI0006FD612F|nr:FecR domain-containing protein [Sphingomonas sp. Leaf343]KQR84250.1 hypothetical protein ASG07_06620 [Sphingomonas sp. Leaf343]